MEVRVKCPDCGRPDLSINTEKKVGWCYRCKKVFGRDRISDNGLLRKRERQDQKILHTPPALVLAWDDRDARAYLQKRLVSQEDAPSVFYDRRGRRLYFRIGSPSPDLPASWHTRGFTKEDGWRVFPGTDKKRYVYCTNSSLLSMPGGPVCVVEGIFDAIRVGDRAVSLLGTDYSEMHDIFVKSFDRVILWLDPDPAGESATRRVLERLRGRDVTVVTGLKEPGDLAPNDRDLRRIKEMLR